MKGVRSSPLTSGTAAEEPVAITQVFADTDLPFSRTECSSANSGLPNSTLVPRLQKRSSESCFWMAAITERMRSDTNRKSTGGTSTSGRPY